MQQLPQALLERTCRMWSLCLACATKHNISRARPPRRLRSPQSFAPFHGGMTSHWVAASVFTRPSRFKDIRGRHYLPALLFHRTLSSPLDRTRHSVEVTCAEAAGPRSLGIRGCAWHGRLWVRNEEGQNLRRRPPTSACGLPPHAPILPSTSPYSFQMGPLSNKTSVSR